MKIIILKNKKKNEFNMNEITISFINKYITNLNK